MSKDIKITFSIGPLVGNLPLSDRNKFPEILEKVAQLFFSQYSALKMKCFNLEFQYSYLLDGKLKSIDATLSHVPNLNFPGSDKDKEVLIEISKSIIRAELAQWTLSRRFSDIEISKLILISEIIFSDTEDKPENMLVDAKSFFYGRSGVINENCERDFWSRMVKATYTPDLILLDKMNKVRSQTISLSQLEKNHATQVLLFNKNAKAITDKLYETILSFRIVFSREADFGENVQRNKLIETLMPVVIERLQEFLCSPIFRFEIKLLRNENANIILLPEIKIYLLTVREYKTETDLEEITSKIMASFSSLDDPRSNLNDLFEIPLSMRNRIVKELAFYVEALEVNILSIPCSYDEMIISNHPANIATPRDNIGNVIRLEYNFVALKSQNHEKAQQQTSLAIDIRVPTSCTIGRNGFGEASGQFFLTPLKLSDKRPEEAKKNTPGLFPSSKIQNLFSTSNTSAMRDEKLLHELLSEKYKTDNPIEKKLHLEKAIRNAAHNGYVDDLKLFLKFREKFSINVDGVFGNGNMKTALHYAVLRFTDQHVECAKLLLESGARLDSKNENGVTAEDMILLNSNPRMKELRQRIGDEKVSLKP